MAFHSQGRHDSQSSLHCAHPVFWSCIWSTWIIKLLAWLAGVTFVVVSGWGLSQRWATAAIDQRQTGDAAEYNQEGPCVHCCATHSPLNFLHYSRSLLFANFLFNTFLCKTHTHMHTHTDTFHLSLILFPASRFSPLFICLPSPLHLPSPAHSPLFLLFFTPRIYFTTLIESWMIQNPHLRCTAPCTNCTDYI